MGFLLAKQPPTDEISGRNIGRSIGEIRDGVNERRAGKHP
jgi:hypothetical protein